MLDALLISGLIHGTFIDIEERVDISFLGCIVLFEDGLKYQLQPVIL